MAEPAFFGQVWLRPTCFPFLVVAEEVVEPAFLGVAEAAFWDGCG